MGHGSDKLYITHSEHAGQFGQHSASTGHKAKQQAPHPGNRTPFDCCALSFQPFSHPVCARNADGTGTVFDLVNIIPWLKQHNNKHPVTGEQLLPASLIALHYSRKPNGEIHDPISFKPFSEHSHIVAVATTGNVFLADSVKGHRDLVADVPIKKEDVITLQNPHGLATATFLPEADDKKAVVAKAKPAAGSLAKAKEVPYNISPYSTGMPGASLTSTSVDVHTATDAALYDEEELMYDAIVNPPKGKKDKDVGRRRAYVRVVTSLGGGSLNLELFCEKAPKTCYNFLMLARQGKYDDVFFHRLIPGFMIQTGDPTRTGAGGESFWGKPFRDEFNEPNAAKHDERGCLAMANKGPDTNGSQWYITFKACPHLDKKHTVFGKLVGGEEVLDALEALPLKDGTDRPAKSVKITEVVIYQDPFEDYKQRLAQRLAKKKEREEGGGGGGDAKKGVAADMNWFGVRVGAGAGGAKEDSTGGGGSVGVGKYLAGTKRAAPEPAVVVAPPEPAKKRKIGFSDFEGW